MYKVLVADDESLVREGILTKLKSGGFAYDWIGEAADGEQAYCIISAERPDIVLTDIRMPYIDGIGLIQKCREAGIRSHFLIITGYAEFEYAKRALELGVDGYLLKPVSDESLAALMQKVLDSLAVENNNRTMEHKLDAISRDMQSLAREKYFNKLFHTPVSGCRKQDAGAEGLFPPECKYFAVLLADLGDPAGESEANDAGALRESARQLAGAVVGDAGCAVMDDMTGSQIIIVIGHRNDEQLKKLASRYARDICQRLGDDLGLPATVSVGGIAQGLSARSYRQAKAAMYQKILQGGGRVYHYEECAGPEKAEYPEHKIRLLQIAIEGNNYSGIEQVLNDIFLSEDSRNYSFAFIRFLFLDISNLLQKTSVRMELKDEDFVESGISPEELLGYFNSKQEFVRYLYTMIIGMLKHYSDKTSLCSGILENIKEYMDQHFAQDLQVKDLARQFAINPNYLSTIFRREFGQTISNYITGIRMEKARHLLTATTLSIGEISQSVGYCDPQYFYKVFKKAMGVTALEYRNRFKDPIPTDG